MIFDRMKKKQIYPIIGFLLGVLYNSNVQSVAQEPIELEIVRSVRVSFMTEAEKQYQVFKRNEIDSGEWESMAIRLTVQMMFTPSIRIQTCRTRYFSRLRR